MVLICPLVKLRAPKIAYMLEVMNYYSYYYSCRSWQRGVAGQPMCRQVLVNI